MARKQIEFDLHTVRYRTRQFDAVTGADMIARKGRGPLELLALTEAIDGTEWVPLTTRQSVNRLVCDPIGILVPRLALERLLREIWALNFGFLDEWRGVTIPARFESGAPSRDSRNMDPLIAAIIQNDQASLYELEEYYSLNDAFKLYDVIVSKSVNAALAHEAAMKEAKANRH